jgi:hypothetical protein
MPAESLVEGFWLDQAQAGNLPSLSGPIEIIFLKHVLKVLKLFYCTRGCCKRMNERELVEEQLGNRIFIKSSYRGIE